MKAIIKTTLICLSFFLCQGCSIFLEEEPENTPIENFDGLWNEFDQFYSHFILKDIDWEAIRSQYRPEVKQVMSDAELFTLLEEMLANLNDGHVQLISPFRSIYSNVARQQARPLNFDFDIVLNQYLNNVKTTGQGRLIYGKIVPNIGYVRIVTFEDEDFGRVDDWVGTIDQVVSELDAIDGLLIDIRNNGGGDAYNAQSLAGRFTNEKLLFGYGYSRNGPNYDDFTDPYPWYIYPEGTFFSKKVVVLTNKITASAAERFLLSMRILPQVTVIGDSTEGAFPHAIPRTLPNGWVVRLTVGVVVDKDFQSYEGKGVPPDEVVFFTEHDYTNLTDPVIERAIEIIKQK